MNTLHVLKIAQLAVRSLLAEAAVYPKPGLVTPLDNGSCTDRTFQHFIDSAVALLPCFLNCASIGMETLELGPEDVFALLRVTGRHGEQEMLQATGGVGTHRGAIFFFDLLCAAAGRLAAQERELTPRALALAASSFVRGIVGRELGGLNLESCGTAEERAFVLYGLEGPRGEAERGFPMTLQAVDLMRRLEEEHGDALTFRERTAHTLIFILSENADGVLVSQGGLDAMLSVQAEARKALASGGMLSPSGRAGIAEMESGLAGRGLCPEDSADILAAALFLGAAHSCLRN